MVAYLSGPKTSTLSMSAQDCLPRAALALLSLTTIILVGCVAPLAVLILFGQCPHSSIVGSSLSFSSVYTSLVAMHYEGATVRYGMEGSESDEEFAKLLPSGGHIVHISPSNSVDDVEAYTVTLFHQLKCLDIIRKEYGETHPSTPELTQHCLTYLHQSILCRPYLGLEVTKNVVATARKSREMVCRDWEAVYEEAERNQAAYNNAIRSA
ncbi:hypothetical protein EDD18DRAFT_1179284 [Armillaria luteobubalina]|uniref:Uncharacterized protein n=1 Tax=Armillaria luteobubalina TaxID=153913 RepID=A0AA39PZA2_9AGAR|nr:hypothetical protein EDD18DRAFT_1179284 [Armillaria luteobubalina]